MNETDLMHEIMKAVSARGCMVFRANVGKFKLSDGRWFIQAYRRVIQIYTVLCRRRAGRSISSAR